jgi:hypothetical protein
MHNKQQKHKRKIIEIKDEKYKTKANGNKNKKTLLKNLLPIYMKLDLDDKLPPSCIHKAKVFLPFE